MTTFDEREKAFEQKFAHDEDLRFKAQSRRTRMIAEWAAAHLGLTGAAVAEYVNVVRRETIATKDAEAVVRKVAADLDAKGAGVSLAEIHRHMDEFLAKAVVDIQAGR